NVLPLSGTLTRLVTLQLSVAFTANVTLLRLHRSGSAASTRLLGHVTNGLSKSLIVILNVQLLVWPLLSVTVLVTVVVPMGKVLPLGGLLTRLVMAQLSVAPTPKFTLLRVHWPGSVPKTKSAGQVITGFSSSVTVTVKVQLL